MSPRSSAAFSGPLAQDFEAFLAYRRDLRTFHAHLGVTLRHLDRFLARHAAAALTPELVDEWMATLTDRAPSTRRNHFRVARQFCLFRARADPAAYVPDVLGAPRVTTRFRPYIYSDREIRALVEAAARLPGRVRPHTYVTLLLILYTTGVRLGEAVRLQLGDVDRGTATLHIREGKFRKARLVPITASLLAHLETYLAQRRRAGAPTHPTAPLFWSPHQRPYSLVGLQAGISRLLSTVCGKRPGRGTGPRAHDIRHSFAVHRLLRWYREGADVQSMLPLLATYLGHQSFVSTQVYLTATPELLAEASRRFHHGFGAVISLSEGCHDIG